MEQYLYHLLDNRQKSTVMDADASLQQGKHQCNRGELLIVLRERTDGIGVNLLDALLFTVLVEIAALESGRILLAVTLGEAEDNAGVKFLVNDESHNLFNFLTLCGLLLLLLPLLLEDLVEAEVVFEFSNRLGEVLLLKNALFIDDKVQTVATSGVNVVLQGSGTVVSVDHIARLLFDAHYPLRKLSRIGDRG